MTPVGGIMVTVALFAVTVTTVFGANDVCLLECRAEKKVLNEWGSQVMREKEVRIIFWKKEGEEGRDRESETSITLFKVRVAVKRAKLDVTNDM